MEQSEVRWLGNMTKEALIQAYECVMAEEANYVEITGEEIDEMYEVLQES